MDISCIIYHIWSYHVLYTIYGHIIYIGPPNGTKVDVNQTTTGSGDQMRLYLSMTITDTSLAPARTVMFYMKVLLRTYRLSWQHVFIGYR